MAGFGRFPGAVRRFRAAGLKVPQIGWNSLRFTQPAARLRQGLEDGDHVYFVHSYYPDTEDPRIIAATADYGGPFAAAIEQGPTMGVQFHPEESQATGLAMLANFAASVRR